MSNINKSFSKLLNEMYIRYKGCLIEKTGQSFKVFGKFYDTEEEAKKAIDNSFIKLKKSIK